MAVAIEVMKRIVETEAPRKTVLAGDMALTDAALEAWARWARTALAGLCWPSWTLLARVIEMGVIGAAHRHGIGRSAFEVDEVCEIVEKAVLRLKEIERKVLVRHYLHWEPVSVSAKALHMSPGRFRTVLHRARRSVRDYLDGAQLRYNT